MLNKLFYEVWLIAILVIQASITSEASSQFNSKNKSITFLTDSNSLLKLNLRTLKESGLPLMLPQPNKKKINFTVGSQINKNMFFVDIIDDFKFRALHQLKSIEVNLLDLSRIFKSSNIHRNIRSVLGKRSQCTLSMNVLIDVKNNIQKALNNKSNANELQCDISLNPSDNCNELIKYIQCGINHLKNGLIMAHSSSFDDVNKWKNMYTTLFEEYEKVIDKVKLSSTQEYKIQLDTLKNNLQELQNSLTQVIHRLKEATKKLCIFEISNGEIRNALIHILELKDANLLSEIITRTYSNFGQLNALNNILNFIVLIHCDHENLTYKPLYEVMKENNQLNSPEILTFHKTYSVVCEKSSSLEKILKEHVENIITGWAHNIRRGDNQQIVEFCKKSSSSCRPYMSELIIKAYGDDLSEFESVLAFDDQLAYLEDSAIVLSTLFSRMKTDLNSNQILRLAYRVKKYMDMSKYFIIIQTYKNMFNSIENGLPGTVRSIIRGSTCTIWSLEYGGYLYATNFKFNSERRYVFTWNPGNLVAQAFWAFETYDEGKTFTIRNTRWNEYLYAANHEHLYNAERRRVFTWANTGERVLQGFWLLTPEDAQTGIFLLKNTVHQNYLYADYNKHDDDRRNVFAWVPEHLPPSVRNERKWRISC